MALTSLTLYKLLTQPIVRERCAANLILTALAMASLPLPEDPTQTQIETQNLRKELAAKITETETSPEYYVRQMAARFMAGLGSSDVVGLLLMTDEEIIAAGDDPAQIDVAMKAVYASIYDHFLQLARPRTF